MGTYTQALKGKAKTYGLEDDPKKAERVNAVKDRIRAEAEASEGLNLKFVGKIYANARREKQELEDQVSEVDDEVQAAAQLLAAIYEQLELSSARNEAGDLIGISWQPHADLKNKDANREWAIKTGLERDLVLPWGTLNALVKKNLLEGKPDLPGVEVKSRMKVQFTPVVPLKAGKRKKKDKFVDNSQIP